MSRQLAGFRAWALQRITAVYLGLYMPFAVFYLLLNPPASYPDWLNRLSDPWVYTSVFLFALAALMHAWIGMRDIAIDYVKPFSVRMTVLLLIAASLIASGFWIAAILFTAIKII